MKFKQLLCNAIARYEPFSREIYLVVDNKVRTVTKNKPTFDKLMAQLETEEWDKNFYSIPKNVQIQITKSCNFRCTFCYANAINSGKPENYMEEEKLLFIIDTLYENGVLNVQYVGGEPFMHKKFINIVDYAKSKGLSQSLISNGIIPGSQIDKYHSVISLFNKIQISVNSSGNRYDELVGVKIYDKLIVAAKNIALANKNVWFSFVVTRDNSSDIPRIMELAEISGCIGVRFGILVKQGRGGSEEMDYFSCLKAAETQIFQSQQRHPSLMVECHFNATLNTYKSFNNHYSEGISMLFINLLGDIYPFPLLEVPEMRLGNIFSDNLLQIWRNSPILNQFRNSDTINTTCVNCMTPCALRSPTISYLWAGKIGAKIPCSLFNYEE